LADVLSIDIEQAVVEKIEINERKYPAEQVRGSTRRSTEYESQGYGRPPRETRGMRPCPLR